MTTGGPILAPIPELQRVVLTEDLPENGLKSGDVGTVVHVATGQGFIVEFTSLAGDTIAVAPVMANQVRPVDRKEVAHARRRAG